MLPRLHKEPTMRPSTLERKASPLRTVGVWDATLRSCLIRQWRGANQQRHAGEATRTSNQSDLVSSFRTATSARARRYVSGRLIRS